MIKTTNNMNTKATYFKIYIFAMLLILIIYIYFNQFNSYTFSFFSDVEQIQGNIKAASVFDYLKVETNDTDSCEDTEKSFTLINLSDKPLNITCEIKGELSEAIENKQDNFILLPDKVKSNQEKIKMNLSDDFLSSKNVLVKSYPLVAVGEEVYAPEKQVSHPEKVKEYENYYRYVFHLKFKSKSKPGIYNGKLAISVNQKFFSLGIPISITIEKSLQKTVIEASYKILQTQILENTNTLEEIPNDKLIDMNEQKAPDLTNVLDKVY